MLSDVLNNGNISDQKLPTAKKFTILTILLADQWKLIEKNILLTAQLNQDRIIEWYIGCRKVEKGEINNKLVSMEKPINVKTHLLNLPETKENNSSLAYLNCKASREHSIMLDESINLMAQTTKHCFLVEADFFIFQNDWLNRIKTLHRSEFKNLKVIGTSYDYGKLKDSLFTPAAHFLSIYLPLPKKFTFSPKKYINPLPLNQCNNVLKLSKACKRNVETGFKLKKNNMKHQSKLLRLYLQFLLLQRAKDSICTNANILDQLTKLRRSQGIIFDHAYSRRMKKANKIIMNCRYWFLSVNIISRKVAIDDSIQKTTKKQIAYSFDSNFELLTYNNEIYAVHFRRNGTKNINFDLYRELEHFNKIINS